MVDYTRRRIVQIGGTGTALALAGCSALDDETDDDPEIEDDGTGDDGTGDDGTGDDGTGDDDGTENGDSADGRTVTVGADIPDEDLEEIQQEFEAEQQEIQEQQESGELSEEEAQQRLQEAQQDFEEAQQELISSAVESIEAHINETDSLELVDSAPEAGVLLVSGDADPLLDLLDRDDVQGLFGEAAFEEFQEPQAP